MTARTRLIALTVGVMLLVVTWVAALPTAVSALEESTFRAFNDLPGWIQYPGWPVMQLGSILAVPLVVVAVGVTLEQWRTPVALAVAGMCAWALGKLLKVIVGRERPDALLSGVNVRAPWEGLGFPSGHAAVAMAVAVVLAAAVGPTVRRLLWVAVLLVGLLRMHSGAHLPLDIVGGWGLGLALGSVVDSVKARLESRRFPSGPA